MRKKKRDARNCAALTCTVHGKTDDALMIYEGNGRYKHVCRKCVVVPCDVHGDDYVSILNGQNTCVACNPDALFIEADRRNGRRRLRLVESA